ncbi:hypothetical protein AB205_0195870 [Aquarana catesbeiana]|uniref:peptidylprolyl isomerase n=1 Tax=Aquarana catesbeiana TaxID=8400 RepID=A0A2G9RPL4_AQUCT|nr:hypothetical protein AB205_0195870 [Aquarana catesbeiana]
MNSDEKLEQGVLVKERGSQYFRVGKFRPAVIQYKKIVQWLEHESGLSDEESAKSKSLLLAAFLNLAAYRSETRVSNFSTGEEPVQLCKTGVKAALPIYLSPLQALEFEPNNEKGLFRRGESYIGVNEFELARDDFTKVIQLYPNNKAARTQMAKCQQRIHEQHQREKKIYANMFQRLAEKEEKESSKAPKEQSLATTDVEMSEATSTEEAQHNGATDIEISEA